MAERSLNEDVADLVRHFREFADVTLKKLPLYRYLAGRVADDDEVAARLLLARPEVRWTTLLMAAVHDRLLAVGETVEGDVDRAAAIEPLCAWYPSIDPTPRPVESGSGDPWPHFRRLALTDPTVEADLRTGATQTNEVGRCAPTVLALGLIEHGVGKPLALIEVGASAGLNLRLDSYRYRFRPDSRSSGAASVVDEIGPSDEATTSGARVLLTSTWRGPNQPPVPAAMPRIGRRVGLDLIPIDVTDAAAARWLVACQWPEQQERLERCRAAVAAAQADPPQIVAGNLLSDVASLIGEVPSDLHPVVLSTWCLAYLNNDEQAQFLTALDEIGCERDLSLVFQEQLIEVPGLDPPERPDGRTDQRPTSLCRYDWTEGVRRTTRLADHHPHGTWIEWLA